MTHHEIHARRTLDAAASAGDVAGFAEAAAQLVEVILDDGRELVAANELEYAIGWLAGKPRAARVLPSMLQLLGAMYEDLGDPERAARARTSARAYAEVARASA